MNELDAGASVTSVAVRELEQLIVTLVLRAGRHNYSHLLESGKGSVQPWQIRLTEEYIEDNWNRPITIELLAKVTGVRRAAFLSASEVTAAIHRWCLSGRRG